MHNPEEPQPQNIMPKYVIERELPGAGDLSKADLQGIAQTSCGVLRDLGPEITYLGMMFCGWGSSGLCIVSCNGARSSASAACSQETIGFQSANIPSGLCRQSQTCSA